MSAVEKQKTRDAVCER